MGIYSVKNASSHFEVICLSVNQTTGINDQ